MWHCRCDCGNECDVSRSNLVYSRTMSCGCLKKSTGEINIQEILKQNNISFVKEKTFSDFIYEDTQAHPRYDFYLPNYNRLIEFDGEQHFKGTGWNRDLSYQKEKDTIKNNYAFQHNIELVGIPYWERDNITLDLILGNKYLLNMECYNYAKDASPHECIARSPCLNYKEEIK